MISGQTPPNWHSELGMFGLDSKESILLLTFNLCGPMVRNAVKKCRDSFQNQI